MLVALHVASLCEPRIQLVHLYFIADKNTTTKNDGDRTDNRRRAYARHAARQLGLAPHQKPNHRSFVMWRHRSDTPGTGMHAGTRAPR